MVKLRFIGNGVGKQSIINQALAELGKKPYAETNAAHHEIAPGRVHAPGYAEEVIRDIGRMGIDKVAIVITDTVAEIQTRIGNRLNGKCLLCIQKPDDGNTETKMAEVLKSFPGKNSDDIVWFDKPIDLARSVHHKVQLLPA